MVQKEVAVGRPVWEGRRLLDRLDDSEPTTFVDEFIRSRANQSLAHVFTMLSLVLPPEPLQIALRGLHAGDENLRGTALEYLESVLPPMIREPLWPFLEDHRPAGRTDPSAGGHSGRFGPFESLNYAEPRGDQAPRLKRRRLAVWENIMLKQGCLIAPREPTPTPGRSRTTGFSRHLPQDLVNDQLGRLALFSLIAMVLWTVSLLLDQLVILTNPAIFEISGGKARVIEVVGVVVSGAMFVYVRYSRHTPEMKTNVSLTYLLLNAAAIAALNTWVAQPPTQGHVVGVSWIAILLLIYSMVAAVSPGRMLAAALVAASFDPIGVWLAHLRGVPTAVASWDAADFLAELRSRGTGDHSVAFSAPRRPQTEQSARAGQLRAGQPARARGHGRSVGSEASPARAQSGRQARPP